MIPTSDTFEILFVDDSVAHVRIAREALAAGVVPHRLTVADTGADALDRLFRRPPYEAAGRPNLVLLDLDLPAVTGLDVLRAIKAEPSLRHVPVVVVTRSPRPEDLAEAYALGANSVVGCPVGLEELAETYRRIVGYWARLNVAPGGVA